MENNFQQPNTGQNMSVAALIIGILSIMVAFIPCFGILGIIGGILAIVFVSIGLSQAKEQMLQLYWQ
ncbi:hypothetical protein OIU83_19785 [Flavobacterium sp. LS1R49]|uniref:DUF4190 domain-containing protein n=1 Tax=Flavobacterium shii TaxID=2987687 RepID=A0A9X2ZEK4_9FLAO|nr:hypothetical protein [Flavobacterium shii]MCV9929911.1 hypothetical protein [Flavobacterium shii]